MCINQSAEKIDLWYAMSDLYLDEEMKAGDYLRIANQLVLSNMPLDELDAIFFNEVHPVLCWTLKAVAGHWGSFGKEWVAAQVTKKLKATTEKGWMARLRAKRKNAEAEELKDLVRCDWEKVKLLIEIIRVGILREISE